MMNINQCDIFGASKHFEGLSTAEYVERLGDFSSRKETGEASEDFSPVAIAGAGLMGRSIAAAFLRVDRPVFLYDSDSEALAAAPKRIIAELACQLAGTERPTEAVHAEAVKRVESLLTLCASPAELDRADVILETIIEKLKVKQRFYRQIAPLFHENKLLLSNTSTIQITELARGLNAASPLTPERFCGFHFFHPVRKRSLLEIIRGGATSDTTIAHAEQIARQIEKRPIVVADGPGFLVNRLLNPYLDESMAILCEGVPLERIESVCRRFGMEMGPFRILDEIGLDVVMHSGWTFYKAFPEYISAPDLLPTMIASGRLGRKNGRGFFLYDSDGSWDGEGIPDPSLGALLAEVGRGKAEWSQNPPLRGPAMSDEIIALRIFVGILFEAGRILADRIVPDAADIDRALIFGLGFPPSKGGITFWANALGPNAVSDFARTLEPLGPKFCV